ncbi:MAG: SAM hydroxide adenosyltransferase [Candidatus Nanohaloarchaea archaeon]|nr:SAM hydroxide adenosyltransferase [Candidatus Nanohaloarchaea archaeon]
MAFLHLIADYGTGDPAFAEVVHRLRAAAPNIQVHPTAVPSFSTIATGFWIAQLGYHNPAFDGLGIYSNTAPRKHDSNEQPDNRGEELVYARLENNVPVIAVNAGYNLSFIRNHISELRALDIPQSGSQFRSRDFFPEAVISILQGDKDHLAEELNVDSIPEPPDSQVAFIDGYGNIKTTLRQSTIDIEPGSKLAVRINGTEQQAHYRTNTFHIEEGDLAIAPGSSGGEDRFIEIFLRGGSAADQFQQPTPGDQINLTRH